MPAARPSSSDTTTATWYAAVDVQPGLTSAGRHVSAAAAGEQIVEQLALERRRSGLQPSHLRTVGVRERCARPLAVVDQRSRQRERRARGCGRAVRARDDPARQDRTADPAAAKQCVQLAALARARDRLPAHERQLAGDRGAAGARRRHEQIDILEAVPEDALQRLLAIARGREIIPQGLPQLLGDHRALRHQAIK